MTIPRFTEEERARIRYHLGYINIDPVSALALGFPSAQQAMFSVETAMDRIIPAAVARTQRMAANLDEIECQMMDALKRLKAQKVDTLQLRDSNDARTEGDLLEVEYRRWAMRLADQLGVTLNPYCERFRGMGPGGGMSARVVHQG